MAINTLDTGGSEHRFANGEAVEYRLTLMLAYTVFLAVAVVARTLPWRWHALGGAGFGGRSVFEEARVRTYGTVPFVFMR